MTTIKRALVSVSDKSGIVEFCSALRELNVEILSTGGTAEWLAEHGIDVIEVSDYTGFPEIMDGRVKTLHPKIHGSLLGRRGTDDDVMQKYEINAIDLVVVNLYPFEQIVMKPDCTFAEAIENIDIGGPAMLRSSAKNHASVAVLIDIADYDPILKEMQGNNGSVSDETRFTLAQKVFAHTAAYDANVSNYLGGMTAKKKAIDFPSTFTSQFKKRQELRYGENPHQAAAFYTEPSPREGSLGFAEQLHGKELSYNNIADTDAALQCVLSFNNTACVIVKHANPCGVATADTLPRAYQCAYATDPTSAFGGVIAFNEKLDAETAKAIIAQQFVEVIIAPEIDRACLPIVGEKKDVRLLEVGYRGEPIQHLDVKRVSGGLLLQDNDLGKVNCQDLKVVTEREPTGREMSDLLFAWHVVKYVKSNAIIYAKDLRTIGIGAGQMSRVYSARIAAIKAQDEKLDVAGSVMASDAFFPFRDGIDSAAAAGIRAVIQPGGSMRDEEVIAAANEAGIAMVFTSIRHFLH